MDATRGAVRGPVGPLRRYVVLLVVTLLMVASVGLQAAPAYAATHPMVTVSLTHEWVALDGGFSANGTATVTIYDAPSGNVLFGPHTVQLDDQSHGAVEAHEHGLDLVGGMVVTAVDDATGVVREVLLEHVSIDAFDLDAETVSGSGPAGRLLRVDVSGPAGEHASLDLTVGTDGSWVADFSGLGVDLDVGWFAMAFLDDGDGDEIIAQGEPPPGPSFLVRRDTPFHPILWNDIHAFDWPVGATLTVDVYADASATDLLYSDNAVVGDPCCGHERTFVAFTPTVELETGQYVVVSDGTTTNTHTVTPLTVDAWDPGTGVVSGTAEPGSTVNVFTGDHSVSRTEVADGTGAWSADLAQAGDEPHEDTTSDLAPGTDVHIAQYDEDGDSSDYIIQVPQPPVINGNLTFDWVDGVGFAPHAQVSVDIRSSPGGSVLFSGPAPTDGAGGFFLDGGGHSVDLSPGMEISVSDGATTKAVVLAALTIDSVDPETGTVSGTAPPNAEVGVFVHDTGTFGAADSAGNWTIVVAGGFDLAQTNVTAEVRDGDDDGTLVDHEQPPQPTFLVRPTTPFHSIPWNQVHGFSWPEGATVTLEVYADDTATNLVHTEQAVAAGLDHPCCPGFVEYTPPVTLQAGQYVVLTDGTTTKAHTVTDLTVDAWDPGTGVVSGMAAAGTEVFVSTEDGSAWRVEVADGTGAWSTNLTVPGDDPDEGGTSTLDPGTQIHVTQWDEDGDSTDYQIEVPPVEPPDPPTIEVDPYTQEVFVKGVVPNAPVALSVNGGAFERTLSSDDFGFAVTHIDVRDFDLQGGDEVVADDGTHTISLTLTHLLPASLSTAQDSISGTAEPGTTVVATAVDNDVPFAVREVTTDADGSWTADFGPTDDPSDATADLVVNLFGAHPGDPFRVWPGMGAHQCDDDGDCTVSSLLAHPRVVVDRSRNAVMAWSYPPGATVELTIDDPSTPGIDHVGSGTSEGPHHYGSSVEWVDPVFGGIDLMPGFVVTVTDGIFTKTHTVTGLTIEDVDLDDDRLTGTADPFEQLRVTVGDPAGGGHVENVVADADGTWIADVDHVLDLTEASVGEISVADDDADVGQLWWQYIDIVSVWATAEPVPVGTDVRAHAEVVAQDFALVEFEWDWGDGTTSPGHEDSHVYDEPGVYEITLTMTDSTGFTDVESFQYVVVYDPDDGFVTGGGWIQTQAGSCHLDAMCAGAEGRANFGFVSRYEQGAAVPTGNTEFNFRVGGFNFRSDSYRWLVVNQGGTNAQFRGEGTVNGDLAPNGEPFQFMIWAGDRDPNAPDTFRMVIWYEDAGTTVEVFDNGSRQAIDGGNIQVHQT